VASSKDQSWWDSAVSGLSNGQELLLTLRTIGCFFVQHKVVAFGSVRNEVIHVSGFRCGNDFFIGSIVAAIRISP